MKLLALIFCLFLFPLSAFAQNSNPQDRLYIDLEGGRVTIELFQNRAPLHVKQIKTLAREGFYDGLEWFRVIPNFMAQTGYPKGSRGKSHLPDLKAEFNQTKFKRGIVGMGRSADPNSANSQFFICTNSEACSDLTGNYTAWGRVISGMELIDALPAGEPPQNPAKIIKMTVAGE
jgi:peptidylprolyl isomerase